MASTNFVNQSTVVEASWLNDVNDFLYEATIPAGTLNPGAANKILYSNGTSSVTWSTTLPATVVAAIDHGSISGLADDDHTQYHNDARALTWLGTRSTTDLPEGSNLYWTSARFDAAFDAKNAYTAGGTDVALADGGTGASLADPNADRIMFWDDSAGTVTWLDVGASLSISGTTLRRAALTGDVTAAVNNNATTLATVNLNVGTFGDAANVAQLTVNGKGLTTAAVNVPIQITESQVTNLTTDLAAKQPLDATLTALAGVTTAANKIIYADGSDSFVTTDLTAAARTVLDDASVSAMVDTLGGASSTGSGGLVRATSPTLVTPILGTPTSGTLTNCTGYTDANLSTSDITTNDVSITKHGFTPKAPNDTTKFLRGDGTWAVPSAASSQVVLISLQTASSSSSIDWTSISASSYDHYIITGDNIIPATDNVLLNFRVSVAAAFQTGASNYTWQTFAYNASAASGLSGSTGDTKIQLLLTSETLGSNTNETCSFHMIFHNANQTTQHKRCEWQLSHRSQNATRVSVIGGGSFIGSTSAVDGFRFLCSSGNIASGTFALYGVKNT